MDSRLNAPQADPHHAGDVVLLTPKDWTDAEQALSKLAHVASERRRPAAGRDFSAGPRVSEPLLESTPRPSEADNLPTDRSALGKQSARRLVHLLVAACVGGAATLAWQAYGSVGMQMNAHSDPQLGGSLVAVPAMNPPSGRASGLEQTSEAAAPTPDTAPAQAAAPAPELAMAPATPSLDSRQLETMSHDLAVLRDTVERLAAGQEQIARDIAKLQTETQDTRRRTSALPSGAPPARKPVPPPASSAGVPPPPQPAPSSSAAQLPPSSPQPMPQLSGSLLPPPDQTLRPPMPVR